MERIELLAPAGDLERLNVAFAYGADAVYFGGQDYSLRANAHNFNLDDIKNATNLAHKLGKRVYVTVNIVFHNKDLKGLEEYLKYLDEIGIDAIICSDIVVIELANKLKVNFELHLSTQASTLNYEQALFYKNLGVTRIVLAREASRCDIKRIKEETGLELECFVHGAMCTSFSGKCVLSNYVTNRDSNRGGCAQVCRFIFDTDSKDFTMMSKDLNMIKHIKDMMDIGVNSFKVEGRMRSIYYIATVIYTYRRIIDKISNNTLTQAYASYCLDILNRVANRESASQFYESIPGVEGEYFLGRKEITNKDFLGVVLDYNSKTKIAKIEQRNYFKVGDKVEFFGPTTEEIEYIVDDITNENGEDIEVSRHPQEIVYLKVDSKLCKGDMMRLKVFDKNEYL